MRKTILTLAVSAALAAAATAQHEGHSHHASPYADQAESGIAALSAQEVEQLRAGAGMGMARAAELNHYPGPKHVLELAAELGLTANQRDAVAATQQAMLAAATRLGAEILLREEQLQRRFAHRHIDPPGLRQATSELALLYGKLRFAHLAAHLETRDLLSDEQIVLYDRLRGYS
jgi:hypothetical protein